MRNSQKRILKKRSGMTLIEITMAVVIIGIVSSYAFAHAAEYTDKAKYARALEDMTAITAALSISYLEHCDIWQAREGTGRTGRINGLDPIFTGDNITEHIGRRLSKKAEEITDPWGNPYIVEMIDENDSMTALVCCMNDTYNYDISEDGENENNGSNGNHGSGNNGGHNGQENGNGGVGNGKGQGAENGQGHNGNNGNHGNGNNGNNGNNGSDGNESGESGIRLNKYAGNTPMSTAITLR
jgi:prepilin-type N-terminal cleavage/methylation domain-containing protein